MHEAVESLRWGIRCEALDVSAPLFHVPEICTVHVGVAAGGVEGFGYAYCWHRQSGEAMLSLGRLFGAKVLGMRLDDWGDVARAIERGFVNFLGAEGMATFVLSALDVAVWDLTMKARGLPLQASRVGGQGPAPCYASRDLWPSLGPTECAEVARRIVGAGFGGVKMWVSNADLARERDRVAAVREAIGKERLLFVDANQVFSPREALAFAELTASSNLGWIEDPVAKDDLSGLAFVCERSPAPIATGENAYGAAGLKRILDAAPIGSALVDLQRIGGITGWMQAEALCAVHGVRLTTHVFHHTGARLLAGRRPGGGACRVLAMVRWAVRPASFARWIPRAGRGPRGGTGAERHRRVDRGDAVTRGATPATGDGPRIRSVGARAFAIPLGRPIVTPVGSFTHQHAVVATIEAGDVEGAFYGWTLSAPEALILRDMIAYVGQTLIGRPATDIAENLSCMRAVLRLTGRTGIGLFAIGVLDACLWDLKGKRAGLPIWRLAGGDGTGPVPAYASGLFLSASIADLRAEAKRIRDDGLVWAKMRIGSASVEEDLRRIDAVRSVLGDGVSLMLDAVMLWDRPTARERIAAYARFDPFWIEDPIDYHEGYAVGELAKLRAESAVPLAAGEFQFGVEPFREIIATKAVDYPMVDLQHVGGLSPWLDVVAAARGSGLAVVPHVFPEMAVHVHCIDRSALPIEYVPWTSALFEEPFVPTAGALLRPSRPGVGLTIAWARIAAWAVGPRISVPG